MVRGNPHGVTLLETLIAMMLVAMAMTVLLVAFVASGQFGVLSRRQATAVALARSLAVTLNHAAYTDPNLTNNNANNDATFADPTRLFALSALPTGNDAPDANFGTVQVGNESYDAYVNVSPQLDPGNAAIEQGKQFAVVVRYRVGGQFMRAVAIGYRYNPATIGVGLLPL